MHQNGPELTGMDLHNRNADLGPNTLKSIQIHYNYFDLSMITITLQLQDL